MLVSITQNDQTDTLCPFVRASHIVFSDSHARGGAVEQLALKPAANGRYLVLITLLFPLQGGTADAEIKTTPWWEPRAIKVPSF